MKKLLLGITSIGVLLSLASCASQYPTILENTVYQAYVHDSGATSAQSPADARVSP
jgi:hypothetical protein